MGTSGASSGSGGSRRSRKPRKSAAADSKGVAKPVRVHIPKSAHGFRFHAEELAVLEASFQSNEGATPLRAHCLAMVAGFNNAEPRHSSKVFIDWKQIKNWFENRRQKAKRERRKREEQARAAGGGDASGVPSGDQEAEGWMMNALMELVPTPPSTFTSFGTATTNGPGSVASGAVAGALAGGGGSVTGAPPPMLSATRMARSMRREALRDYDTAWERLERAAGELQHQESLGVSAGSGESSGGAGLFRLGSLHSNSSNGARQTGSPSLAHDADLPLPPSTLAMAPPKLGNLDLPSFGMTAGLSTLGSGAFTLGGGSGGSGISGGLDASAAEAAVAAAAAAAVAAAAVDADAVGAELGGVLPPKLATLNIPSLTADETVTAAVNNAVAALNRDGGGGSDNPSHALASPPTLLGMGRRSLSLPKQGNEADVSGNGRTQLPSGVLLMGDARRQGTGDAGTRILMPPEPAVKTMGKGMHVSFAGMLPPSDGVGLSKKLASEVEAWRKERAPLLDAMSALSQRPEHNPATTEELTSLLELSRAQMVRLYGLKERIAREEAAGVASGGGDRDGRGLTKGERIKEADIWQAGSSGLLFIGDLMADELFLEIQSVVGPELGEAHRERIAKLQRIAVAGERALNDGLKALHMAVINIFDRPDGDLHSTAADLAQRQATTEAASVAQTVVDLDDAEFKELQAQVSERGGLELLVRAANTLRLRVVDQLMALLTPLQAIKVELACADVGNVQRVISAIVQARLHPSTLSPKDTQMLSACLRLDSTRPTNERTLKTSTIVKFGWGKTGSGLSRLALAAQAAVEALHANNPDNPNRYLNS